MARHTNRLASQTSPYLLQHAHNPVDWHPWGPEALELARTQGKAIFLSVGYSTCYWCHVMERECFENEAIAELMNRHFINIKVDREERADIDQLYMTAVQIIARQGGWPMSVWLTPDLKPFYGGTYFPPTNMHGRPGFPQLLDALADAWANRRDEVLRSADELAGVLQQFATIADPPAPLPDAAELDALVLRSCDDYEPRYGGFGQAPKFPRQTLLRLLLTWIESKPTDNAHRKLVTDMLRRTLDAMANGGIRDHLGGGFHRYSTDARWLVPHFEIMLYDQAMLAPVYARASRVLGEPRFASVARGICEFVLRELTSADGAFFTGLDAEVNAREGQNYLWTPDQIRAVLGDDADTFNAVYGLDRGFNFADPHHSDGTPDTNVLYLPDGPARVDEPAIVDMRAKLLKARGQRDQPRLDDKVITSWNAMMIQALAACGTELNEPRYRDAAIRTADYLLATHWKPDGLLYRTSHEDSVQHHGFLDDYAELAVALQELAIGTSDRRWKTQADKILDAMLIRFGPSTTDDSSAGLFFTHTTASDLIVRQKLSSDSPLPAGNATAALALMRAGRLDAARAIIEAFGGTLRRHSESMSAMLEATLLLREQGDAWSVSGDVAGIGWTSPDEPPAEDIVTLSCRRIGKRRVDICVEISPGYHLYDTNTDVALGLTPTRLRVAAEWAERVEFIDYPPARELHLAFGPPVRGYDGSIDIAVRFSEDLPDGKIDLSLSFQACNDNACLLPSVARCEG
ncbi:MAG: DUF255 domain-containing protein [Tepidisphaeraceae bacterium]